MTPSGAYVGYTGRDPKYRVYDLRSKRGIEGTIEIVDVINSKKDALALERALRPDWNMGLNIARGGGASYHLPSPDKHYLAKRVMIDGKEYGSIKQASLALGFKITTVHYRLSSKYYPTWRYITPPTASYVQNVQAGTQPTPAKSAYRQQHMAARPTTGG